MRKRIKKYIGKKIKELIDETYLDEHTITEVLGKDKKGNLILGKEKPMEED